MKALRDVTAVDNQITARPDFAAGATGERIGQALSRHAGREAHHTVVDARDGTVTLTGTIGAHAEHETARGAAWSTRSVHAVADNLEVESGR
ncbi:OsmY domain-containing protein [Caballeronia terrestris]|uniref:OsmY domain-containing protein n=2 Tax=Caballeronia TaxID=1827195 RepID=A0A158KXZ0_9BURK|nr:MULTISPECIES: BON domain-containing protein [Caballeronia]SAL62164.1 OsmY domain-containing protein [Caballeronia humi]SAL85957.1 OsmY domain-containing protein [Caballeronia terrestris]